MIVNLVSSRREAILLLAADTAGIFGLFNVAHFLRVGQGMPWGSWSLLLIAAIFLLTMYVFDVYGGVLREGASSVAIRTLLAVLVAAGVVASIVYVIKPPETDPLYWRGVLPVGTAMFLLWAVVWRKILVTCMRSRGAGRWLVLGYGRLANSLWRDIGRKSDLGQLYFLKQEGEQAKSRAAAMPMPEGDVSALPKFLKRSWSGVILAGDRASGDAVLSELMQARLRGLRIYDLTDFYERFLFKLPILNLHDNWLVLSQGFGLLHNTVQLRAKRVIDLVLSLILIIALLPLMVIIVIAIKIDSKGPVFYRQIRTGLYGKTFTLFKFRTMVDDAEKFGARWAEKNDPRVTGVGRLLRATRLDELPQLWNVLLGEMSFIGPRPERPDFVADLQKAIPYYELRHLVKPGITGWAQVLYPYGASVEDAREKLQYDLYYIKNYSVMLDLVILVRTLRVVFLVRGR